MLVNRRRLLRSSSSGALVLVLAVTGSGVLDLRPDEALVATGTADLPDTWDGLTRAVVTLETGPVTGTPPAITSVTSGAVLPAALLAAPAPGADAAPALPRLDLLKHARAVEELGRGGALVRGDVAGEDVTLYLLGDAARVVSTGPSWEASPADVRLPAAVTPGEAPHRAGTAPSALGGLPGVEVATTAPGSVDQLAALRATAGVLDVLDLRDGSFLVTSSLSLGEVGALPPVETASPSVRGELFAGPAFNDPYVSYGWHLDNTGTASQQAATAGADVSARDAWPRTTGAGAVIAVLDSGYDTDHPDLAGAQWRNPGCLTDADGDGITGDCGGWNFYSRSADVDNGGGAAGAHGTWVSGTAAARIDNGQGGAGLAPDATIMPLVIGSGSQVDMGLANAAIRYAADHGADVVNASFGGALPASSSALTALRSAVAYAESKGVLVVAAAGNAAQDIDATPVYPASLTEPNVITVGSSTASDGVSGFSNTGARGVDLFAPGSWIFATSNSGGYSLVSGTSFSAPLVAAAAALHRSATPSISAAALRTELMATATPLAAFTGRSVSGGRLSVESLSRTGLDWSFARLGAVASGGTTTSVTPTITARTVPGAAVTSPDTAAISVITRYQGQIYAVTGTDVVVGGRTLTTDDAGTVQVPLTGVDLAAGVSVSPTLGLPDGEYAVVVDLLAGGAPVAPGRAAPLTIGPVATPSPTRSGSTGGAVVMPSAPSTTAGAPSTGAPTTIPTSTAPPTGAPAPTGTATGGTGGPTPTVTASSTSTAGSLPVPPAPTTAPTTAPDSTATPTSSGATASSTSRPTTTTPRTGAGTTTPAPTTAPASPTSTLRPSSTPTPAPTRTYPGTDAFGITGVSPSVVSTAGGARVVVTGTSIPSDVRVLVSAQGAGYPAQVVSVTQGSAGRAVLTVPARIAGTYDLVLSSGGSVVTLPGALQYQAPAAIAAPSTSSAPTATATTAPTTTPSSGTRPTTAPTTGPTPTTSVAAPTPTTITTPGGLTLRRSARWSALPASTWSLSGCSTECAGSAV